MLSALQCKWADLVYLRWQQREYALKECNGHVDVRTLGEYIEILKRKIELLKYKYRSFNNVPLLYQSWIRKTSLQDFYQKEIILKKCDKKFLEKIQKYI